MNEIESIENSLQRIIQMLNEVATDLAKSEMPCCSADIRHVGEALVAIFDIQTSIYEVRPDLMPEYLSKRSDPDNFNRKYSRIKTQNQYLLANNQTKEALKLLTDFIDSKPTDEFIELASKEIIRIKKLFNI